MLGFYGLSSAGCLPCPECPPGKVCSTKSGRCECPKGARGPRCQHCASGHVRRGDHCEPCRCGPGALSDQCDEQSGQCRCRVGWAGPQCSSCAVGHFGPRCRRCSCHPAGTKDCTGDVCPCDDQGQCPCKENVVGEKCSECLEGTFGLSAENPTGCTACFCFGRATRCQQAQLARATVRDAAPRHITLVPAPAAISVSSLLLLQAQLARATVRDAAPRHITLVPAPAAISVSSLLLLQAQLARATVRDAAPRHITLVPAPAAISVSSLLLLQAQLARATVRDAAPRHITLVPAPAAISVSSLLLLQAQLARATVRDAAPRHITLVPAPAAISVDENSLIAIPMDKADSTIAVPEPPVPVYVALDKRFLGDRVTSYGGFLRFRVEEEGGEPLPLRVLASFPLVRIDGADGIVLNHYQRLPSQNGSYSVRLHESQWEVRGLAARASRPALLAALRRVQRVLLRASSAAPAPAPAPTAAAAHSL
ncbi:hypothetical protein ACJJTC_002756 [Scirpophaga incertulas]